MPIESVPFVKYLGVYYDRDLSWNAHLANVGKRLWNVSFCLYSIIIHIPLFARKLHVPALAYSVFRYGVTLFVHRFVLWQSKVDCISKNVLKSVAYDCGCSCDESFFFLFTLSRAFAHANGCGLTLLV